MRRLTVLVLGLGLAACQAEPAEVGVAQADLGTAVNRAPDLAGPSGGARERAATFVRWASNSSPGDVAEIRRQLAAVRTDATAVAALAEHALDTSDHSQALVALSLLGEMRSPHAEPHLRRVVTLPLPPATGGEHDPRGDVEMLQAKAVDGLAYLHTATADAEVLRVAAYHESRAVRAEAIDAYLFNHGDSEQAQHELARRVAPADLIFIDRPRYVPGETAEQFDAKLAVFLKKHPEAQAPAPTHREVVQVIRKLLYTAVILAAAPTAYAVCVQSSASTADKDLYKVHGCWSDYFVWEAGAYGVRSADWGNRGWNDACNINLEYTKHWNAAYLISYGLPDNTSQRTQWHGTVDYQGTAVGYDNAYHDDTYQAPTDDTSVFGRWTWEPFDSNKVETSCLLYNATSANANPASRGGDFIHEGWHGWQWMNWYSPSHTNGPVGNCTASGNACDYFYFHPVGQYAFGTMNYEDGTAKWFHSPNQVQVEYLCDIATNAKSWVPLSVRTAAAADANQRAVQRFINGPGIKCSAPTPLFALTAIN